MLLDSSSCYTSRRGNRPCSHAPLLWTAYIDAAAAAAAVRNLHARQTRFWPQNADAVHIHCQDSVYLPLFNLS